MCVCLCMYVFMYVFTSAIDLHAELHSMYDGNNISVFLRVVGRVAQSV